MSVASETDYTYVDDALATYATNDTVTADYTIPYGDSTWTPVAGSYN